MHSFLLITYYVPGVVLGSEVTVVSQSVILPRGANTAWGLGTNQHAIRAGKIARSSPQSSAILWGQDRGLHVGGGTLKPWRAASPGRGRWVGAEEGETAQTKQLRLKEDRSGLKGGVQRGNFEASGSEQNGAGIFRPLEGRGHQ